SALSMTKRSAFPWMKRRVSTMLLKSFRSLTATRRPILTSAIWRKRLWTADFGLFEAQGFQFLPLRNRDAPIHQTAGIAGSVADGLNDSARFLHDEIECRGGNVSHFLAGVRENSSVCAIETDARLPDALSATRRLARGNHRLCGNFVAAECRCP